MSRPEGLSRRALLGGSLAALASPRLLRAEGPPHAASDPSCVFCQIVNHSSEATFVWQDDLCVAFGSISPLQPGHVLLVPRQHVVTLYDLPADVGAHLLPVASRIGRTLKETLHADGLTLLQNNEKASGQAVFHFHMHLIPRHAGQEVFKTLVQPPKATQAELEAVLAPVRKALGKLQA